MQLYGHYKLSKVKNMERIEVEGDAKSCFDAIKESCSTTAWFI